MSFFYLWRCAKVEVSWDLNRAGSEIHCLHFGVKKFCRVVGLVGMNFQKKRYTQKMEKELKQLSGPPKRMVVEMVGGSDLLSK